MKVRLVDEPAVTVEGDTVSVPEPSGEALTLTLGDDERLVSVPEEDDSSSVEKLMAPVLAGGSAPVEPPPDP